MPLQDAAYWTDLVRQTLLRYRGSLVREVAARLVKPRGQWPVEELIDRCVASIGNPVQIDRRLKELPPASRQILAAIAHSRQPRWRLGSLLEIQVALGHAAALQPVLELLDSGLLYPVLSPAFQGIALFAEWAARSSGTEPMVFTHPSVAVRARGEELPLPLLAPVSVTKISAREADGLEWPLRLSALWQQVAAGPLRRTQNGDFFKRDLDRLRQDPLLSTPPADSLTELPDPARLAAALAETEGILQEEQGEVRAAALPAAWDAGLPVALESLYTSLFLLRFWNALDGGLSGDAPQGNPFPSAYLLLLLVLSRQPADAWCSVAEAQEWLFTHHPYWSTEEGRPSRDHSWVETFVLGLAYDLRVVQAARDRNDAWAVRLSPLGRWLLGLTEQPPLVAAHAQTLLVQPNLEIIAYRQGLTPGLIVRLSLFAAWKNIGTACTLQLGPETVYRALERGLTFETILHTLDQHGARATPAPVIDSLRTWADKRERISVYASACLLEFNHPDDLTEAVTRGLPATRLSDRLALVASEDAIEFRHFRLTGTRDYSLPADQCVTVEPDGVRLTVDPARSDLLLETELPRFAELLPSPAGSNRRQYRLTPASLAMGREGGLTLPALEEWFQQRTGQALPPAVRLLLSGSQNHLPALLRYLVLSVDTEEMADGLLQWPETRPLILERLGPRALAVAEEQKAALLEKLGELGIVIADERPLKGLGL